MENPQFLPELIFPTTPVPIPSAHDLAILDKNPTPVYIESSIEQEVTAKNT
jgi:hypothetical protein